MITYLSAAYGNNFRMLAC